MGFWNDGIRMRSGSRSRSRSRSRSHSPSRTKVSRAGSSSSKHYASRPSFARSASSFLSGISGTNYSRGRSHSSRARPRDGFMAKIRKFLRDLYSYMRRHPVKVFFLVIMPLITGGALSKILATFGVRLPRGLEQMVGSSAMRNVGQTERYFSRGGARDFTGGSALPGMMGMGGGGGGLGDTIQGALGIAKMFM